MGTDLEAVWRDIRRAQCMGPLLAFLRVLWDEHQQHLRAANYRNN